jgi:hypothetical protein
MSTLSGAEWKRLCEVMNGYVYSQALASACELDLFTFLSAHPGSTREEVRKSLGLSEYAARVLLLACCAAGLVRKDADTGRYSNSGVAEKALVAGAPGSMLAFVRFNHEVQRRCGTHLTRALREGRNAGLDEFPGPGRTLYERLRHYPDLERLFHEAMGAYTSSSPGMLDIPEFSQVNHLLDVGGGDGTSAVALCRRHAALRVTLLDTPSVAALARAEVARHGLAGRVRCVAGDLFADPWPDGCDGVLLSHLVEIFAADKVRAIYAKAFAALPPGGRLFVWTIMANDAETGGLQATKSSIYFLSTASGEGMAYPGARHDAWLREAGFRAVERRDAPDIEHGALIALKG